MMKEEGAVNAMMSGSGPTVFGLFTNPSGSSRMLMKSFVMVTLQTGKTGISYEFFNVETYPAKCG